MSNQPDALKRFFMGLSMIGIALMSELLVASVEAVTDTLGLTPFSPLRDPCAGIRLAAPE